MGAVHSFGSGQPGGASVCVGSSLQEKPRLQVKVILVPGVVVGSAYPRDCFSDHVGQSMHCVVNRTLRAPVHRRASARIIVSSYEL